MDELQENEGLLERDQGKFIARIEKQKEKLVKYGRDIQYMQEELEASSKITINRIYY